jgi:hypothetical protein
MRKLHSSLHSNTNNDNLSYSRGQDAYVKTSYGILRCRDAEGGSEPDSSIVFT